MSFAGPNNQVSKVVNSEFELKYALMAIQRLRDLVSSDAITPIMQGLQDITSKGPLNIKEIQDTFSNFRNRLEQINEPSDKFLQTKAVGPSFKYRKPSVVDMPKTLERAPSEVALSILEDCKKDVLSVLAGLEKHLKKQALKTETSNVTPKI
jgi:hypothetical protein